MVPDMQIEAENRVNWFQFVGHLCDVQGIDCPKPKVSNQKGILVLLVGNEYQVILVRDLLYSDLNS